MSDESQCENPIDPIVEDFVARLRRGEHPALSEYAARHPELADEIRELFPALILMERARPVEPGRTSVANRIFDSEKLPEKLDDFRILREIGRGGMGVVYEAIQESLGRHVALKVLPRQVLVNDAQAQRFQREARAAARLNHPNIVPVFGVGEADGIHYYSMQFVRGLGLDQVVAEIKRLQSERFGNPDSRSKGRSELSEQTDVTKFTTQSAQVLASGMVSGVFPIDTTQKRTTLASNELPSSEATDGRSTSKTPSIHESSRTYWRSIARIGEEVALALQYAADEGVLHRDIKPANLLLDLEGKVWVTDFGLATELSNDGLTQTGDIIGTLRYMAPERLKGISSPLVDVYSLGASLYEMLTLQPLFGQLPREQMLQAVSSVSPRRPRSIVPGIPQDLETIVLKAISKEPSERYASAKQLAQDLRCFLENRPILARQSGTLDQVWKWGRRNPAVASLISVSTGLLLLLTVGIWVSSIIRAERDEAVRQRELAQQARDENAKLLNRALIAEKESRVREHLAKATTIQRSGKEGQRHASLEELRIAADYEPSEQLQRELADSAISAFQLLDLKPIYEFPTVLNVPSCFDHQGKRFVQVRTNTAASQPKLKPKPGTSAYSDFSLHIRNADDWSKVAVVPGPDCSCWYAMPEFTPKDHYLIVTYLPFEAKPFITCRDANSMEVVHTAEVQSSWVTPTIAYHPNGNVITYQEPNADIVTFDLAEGRECNRIPFGMLVYDLCLNSDATQLAVLPVDNSAILLLDAKSGIELNRFVEDRSSTVVRTYLAWSSDDQLLAASCTDGSIEIWNTPQKNLSSIISAHSLAITGLQFDSKGYLLLSISYDGSRKICDAAIGRELVSTERDLLSFTSDGGVGFTTGTGLTGGICQLTHEDHIQRLHDPTIGNSRLKVQSSGIASVAFNSDESLMIIHTNSYLDFWDVRERRKLNRIQVSNCRFVAFHPEGSSLLTALPDGLYRWPIHQDTNELSRSIEIGPPEKVPLAIPDSAVLTAFDWIPKTQRLAIFAAMDPPQLLIQDLTLPLTDIPTILKLPADYRAINGLSVSPDGMWLAAGSFHHGTVPIWNLKTSELHEIVPEPANPTPAYTVSFTRDSRQLFIGNAKETTKSGYHVYSVGSWQQTSFRPASITPTKPVMFRNQNRLVAMTEPNEVHISDIDSGRLVSRIQMAESRFNIPVALLNNDAVMATISGVRTEDILLWNLERIKSSLEELGLTWDLDLQVSSSICQTRKPIQLTIHDGGLIDRSREVERLTKLVSEAERLTIARRFDEAVASLSGEPDFSRVDSRLLNAVAWALVTRLECSSEQSKCAVKLTEQALALTPTQSAYWNTLGVARYRNLEYELAIEALMKSESLEPDRYFFDNTIFIAMSYWKIGNQESARTWLEKALASLEKVKTPTEERLRFRREAEELMKDE